MYLIGNAEELKTFRDYVNNEAETRVEEGRNYVNVSAVLTADIDLKGEVWTPICDDSQGTGRAVRYEGTFDGAGYAIKDLTSLNAKMCPAFLDISKAALSRICPSKGIQAASTAQGLLWEERRARCLKTVLSREE